MPKAAKNSPPNKGEANGNFLRARRESLGVEPDVWTAIVIPARTESKTSASTKISSTGHSQRGLPVNNGMFAEENNFARCTGGKS